MPCHDCPLEQALVKTKSSKSHKKEKCCPSVCETECCLPDCHPDCCTPAFLRLDKLRTIMATNAALPTGAPGVGTILNGVSTSTIQTRAGTAAQDPTQQNTFQAASAPGNVGAVPLIPGAVANAFLSYAFVNAERYVSFESCGKEDQVVGWYVDTATGNLELYQNLPELNLTTQNNRLYLDSIPTASLTSVQKQQLYQLNNLYKLSVQAIERVGANSKTEGNICEYTDKCGQKWLLLINRASAMGQTVNGGPLSAATNNTQWTLVGVRLC